MIFVDTGAWFALAVKEDADHEEAVAWLETNGEVLVTSDYVVVETINLIRFRDRTERGHRAACDWATKLWAGELAIVRSIGSAYRASATEILRKYGDKVFSFTDCSSFALMEAEGIPVAFAFDHNFDQYPGIRREP